MHRLPCILAVLLTVYSPLPSTAQTRPGLPPRDNATAQTGTGRIRGRVVSADTAAPLRRAQVTITAAEVSIRRFVTTDAEGRYDFTELPAARYIISANKAGYVTLQYGQRRPFEPGTPVALATGQDLTQVDLALPRGSVITGRVTDEFGEPIANATIQVQRYQYRPGGQRQLTFAGGNGVAPTDDLGQFRAFGLMPGEYIVSASVRAPMLQQGVNRNDTAEGYPPTFYPGTINPAEAQGVIVGLGQETSLQITLQAAKMARIFGTLVNSEGKPVAGADLVLGSRSGPGIMTMALTAADGSFTLTNVPPGEHHIDVPGQQRTADGSESEAASVPITVAGEDILNLRITTGRGATVSGRVVFEGSSPHTGPNPLRINAVSADPQVLGPIVTVDPLGLVDDDGNFQVRGLIGTVFFRGQIPPGWMLKSVTLDGDDITDVPLELTSAQRIDGLRIVLTDRMTDVSGGVSSGRGQPVKDYVVVLQPATPRQGAAANRYVRNARPDQDGRFRVRGMPTGDYIATAVESLEAGREWDPEYQPKLREAGRPFSLNEGESVVLDLTLAEGI
jgi:hypothetical protein